MFTIYALFDTATPSEIRYIGKTQQLMKKRLACHLWVSMNGGKTHTSCWIRSVILAGSTIGVSVVGDAATKEESSRLERERIKLGREKGERLTNHTDGGEGCFGWKPSELTIKRMSLSHKGIPKPPRSKEHCENIRASKLGKTMPESTRVAIFLANHGKPRPEHVRLKISNSNMGKKFTEEHREKLRMAKLGIKRQPFSEEHKRKIGISRAAAHAKRKEGYSNLQ